MGGGGVVGGGSFYLMGWSPAFWTVGKSFVTGHLDDAKKKEDKGDLTGKSKAKQPLTSPRASHSSPFPKTTPSLPRPTKRGTFFLFSFFFPTGVDVACCEEGSY